MEATAEKIISTLAAVRRDQKAAAAVYQGALKREVARVSGIDFEKLAHLPFAEWAALREHYLGSEVPISD